MDVFRAGEAVLRSSQPLLPFLAPSVFRSRGAGGIAQRCRAAHQLRAPTSRSFASSCLRQQQPAAAARPKEDDHETTQDTSTDAEFQALVNSAMEPASPPSRSQQRPPQHYPQTSSTDLLAALSPNDSSTNTTPATRPKMDFASLFSSNTPVQQQRTGPPPPPPPPQAAPMRLNSSLGRTITVDPERGMDVGRAFRVLEQRCWQNNVRRQYIQDRFHERPGLKRKRLKRERWRRRFKENFKATVKMVQRMKKQGW